MPGLPENMWAAIDVKIEKSFCRQAEREPDCQNSAGRSAGDQIEAFPDRVIEIFLEGG